MKNLTEKLFRDVRRDLDWGGLVLSANGLVKRLVALYIPKTNAFHHSSVLL